MPRANSHFAVTLWLGLLAAGAPNLAHAQETNSNCTALLQTLAQDNTNGGSQSTSATDQSCFLINQTAQNASIFSFDYGVPRSPALMLAGLSPDKVTPANSLKPFVLSLPSLFGADSGSSSSAFDFAPAWVLNDSGGGVVNYSNDRPWGSSGYWNRVWYRTRLSGALSKGDSGGDDPTKAVPSRGAIGISLSLLDSSDPIMARTDDDVLIDPITKKAVADPGTGNPREVSHWVHCLALNKDKIVHVLEPAFYDFNTATSEVGKLTLNAKANKPFDANRLIATQRLADKALGRTTPWEETTEWTDPVQRKAKWEDSAGRITSLDALAGQLADARDKIDVSAAKQETKEAIESCSQEASNLAQHGADLQIGAGVVFQGPPGSLTSLSEPNGALWLSGRLPLDFWNPSATCEPSSGSVARNELACWTIGGSGRYSAGEMEATGNADTPEFKANVLEGWAGIERVDSKSKFGAYLGYTDQRAASDADNAFSKSGTRWLFSGAYLLLSDAGMWVVGSYGNANGTTTTLDDKVAMLSLTFGPPKIGSGFVSPAPQAPAANTVAGTASGGGTTTP